ncbi:MAG: D-alanyl-D-alanine carboxypeptidase/D-alanyl-D-alanine-endopeptidase [Candidatus Gastranaerophilales bacterium]|nr:D-alanyl-D-alanine carboxypeptidase/D-alanyl-D-alanine-endopeptidase [Candidatus Gastranaerophilales bacterium]
MKNTFKIFLTAIVFFFAANNCFALHTAKIEKIIKTSKLDSSSTIAVSIKNVSDGRTVFEYNQNKLLHPASVLKIFTLFPAVETLGYDYFFKTGFYKDSQNNLYIKLGADPLLTSTQLKQAFSELKSKGCTSFNNLYIDDSVLDKKEFAPGWMWDDDINPYTPKVSAYNIDCNLLNINLTENNDNTMKSYVKSGYPVSVITAVNSGGNNDVLDIVRYNWQNPEIIEIYGSLSKSKQIQVPFSSVRRYFIYIVSKALEDNRINIKGTLYSSKLTPDNSELITEIANPITTALPLVLQNSNNLAAETIFKLASNKKYAITGSNDVSLIILKDFYNNNDVKTDDIIIKDGSGVSRNNLLYADWITTALNKLYKHKDFEQFKDNMAQPGDGTLSSRLHDLRGEAWLKTGSLSNISAIAGYIKSQDGHVYSIAILTQNFTEPQKDVKSFEDEIIKLIYNR